MRYGLTFAEGNPFPQDVNLGIQLDDETVAAPIVVPEDCPECPDTCEPDFKYWFVFGLAHLRTGGSEGAPVSDAHSSMVLATQLGLAQGTGDTVSVDYVGGATSYAHTKEIILTVNPFFESCGHSVRLTVDCNDAGFSRVFGLSEPSGTTLLGDSLIELPGGGPAGDLPLVFFFGPPYGLSAIASTPHATIEIKMQIDLTDAAPGSETWTDFGPTLHLDNFT